MMHLVGAIGIAQRSPPGPVIGQRGIWADAHGTKGLHRPVEHGGVEHRYQGFDH